MDKKAPKGSGENGEKKFVFVRCFLFSVFFSGGIGWRRYRRDAEEREMNEDIFYDQSLRLMAMGYNLNEQGDIVLQVGRLFGVSFWGMGG